MVVQTLLWIAVPGVVYGILLACLPPAGPPARWRVRLRRMVDALLDRWRGRRPVPPPAPPDPFVVLSVQIRLGLVAAQLRALEDDPAVWARARRIEATRAAYDDLLAEACRMAGVDVADRSVRTRTAPERERFRAETELASRGWSW